MKKFFMTICLSLFCVIGMMAQADKILGNYLLDYNGRQSKVKITKNGDGYRAQTYWVRESKNADGSVKLDTKNPDKAKRNIPVTNIIIIDKVKYDGEKYCNGKIYDPTSGKTYNVEIRIKDEKNLEVRAKLGPFFKRLNWSRI